MKSTFGWISLALLLAVSSTQQDHGNRLVRAVCSIRGVANTTGANAVGTIFLTQQRVEQTFPFRFPFTGFQLPNPVLLDIDIRNLPDGWKGYHVHEFGDLSDTTNPCLSTGAHFNPEKVSHGGPQDGIRHVGDLGNILVTNSVARFATSDSVISLQGSNSIIGRAIVIHEKEDDLGRGSQQDSKTTGASGGRIACCVITLAGTNL